MNDHVFIMLLMHIADYRDRCCDSVSVDGIQRDRHLS